MDSSTPPPTVSSHVLCSSTSWCIQAISTGIATRGRNSEGLSREKCLLRACAELGKLQPNKINVWGSFMIKRKEELIIESALQSYLEDSVVGEPPGNAVNIRLPYLFFVWLGNRLYSSYCFIARAPKFCSASTIPSQMNFLHCYICPFYTPAVHLPKGG